MMIIPLSFFIFATLRFGEKLASPFRRRFSLRRKDAKAAKGSLPTIVGLSFQSPPKPGRAQQFPKSPQRRLSDDDGERTAIHWLLLRKIRQFRLGRLRLRAARITP